MSLIPNRPSKPQLPVKLAWLFVAFFEDGSVIKQTQEDASKDADTTQEQYPSAFRDVEARGSELHNFELHHIDGKQIVGVDLVSGYFVVNGTPLQLHNQNFEAEKYEKKLVYFRIKREEVDKKYTVQEDMSIKEETVGDPRSYVHRYFIGWVATDRSGKEKQVTLAVG